MRTALAPHILAAVPLTPFLISVGGAGQAILVQLARIHQDLSPGASAVLPLPTTTLTSKVFTGGTPFSQTR